MWRREIRKLVTLVLGFCERSCIRHMHNIAFSILGNWNHTLVVLSFINLQPLTKLQNRFIPSVLLPLTMLSLSIPSLRSA